MPRRVTSTATANDEPSPRELENSAPLRRTPGKEKYWRQQIAAQKASGLSAAKYCQRTGLNVNNFHWWAREVRERDKVQAMEMLGAEYRQLMNEVEEEAKANPFIPVKVSESTTRLEPLNSSATERGNNGSLDIVLRSGATIRVSDGTPMKLLLRVLKMLEEEKC